MRLRSISAVARISGRPCGGLSYKGASEPAEGDAIAAAAPVDNKAHDRGFLSVSEAECDEQLIQLR